MAAKRYLVTSALPYANGRLHVGHIAGAYLPADTYVRYRRARGDEVRFVCGSDDNGVASLISARKEGKSVEDLTAHYNARQAADFAGLGIEFDIYGGTHQPAYADTHTQFSQAFFKTLYDKGVFKKVQTQQLYDEQAEQFLPDRYVKGRCHHCGFDEAYGDQCEHCGQAIDPVKLIDPVSTITGTTPVARQTTHWHIALHEFEADLETWLEAKRTGSADSPAWRDGVLNFSLGQVKQGLPERAMTRDLDWGISVPLDDPDAKNKVLYVWFDAPIGYVSFTAALCQQRDGDAQAYANWWKDPDCRIAHFIGEDNTIFHALIWPAMLMAEGSYQLPWQVVVNAFLNIKFPGQDEQKISKSRGTAIWIEEYLRTFDPDPLRYYLTAVAPENQRTTFDIDDFISRNNSELLAALGNFVNRTVTFAHRYFDGQVPAAGALGPSDEAMLRDADEQVQRVTDELEQFHFRGGLSEMMALARQANGYFEEKAPWKQRKQDPAGCATTIHVCLRTVRALATLMAPFLPFSAARCADMLQIDRALAWDQATAELEAGKPLGEAVILFKKIDAAEMFDGDEK